MIFINLKESSKKGQKSNLVLKKISLNPEEVQKKAAIQVNIGIIIILFLTFLTL